MGLLTILKKVKAKEKELRILILGLDNAGKTTIMKRVTGGDHHEISPTGKQVKHFKKNSHFFVHEVKSNLFYYKWVITSWLQYTDTGL